jgi:hypothetical protein
MKQEEGQEKALFQAIITQQLTQEQIVRKERRHGLVIHVILSSNRTKVNETEPFLGLPLVLVCDSIIESSLFSMFKTEVCFCCLPF